VPKQIYEPDGPEHRKWTRDLDQLAAEETMPKAEQQRVSDEAVQSKTGRTWEEWFAELDVRSADKLDHKGIVALLGDFEMTGWWRQSVAVAYEQARGLRAPNEAAGGFQVSASKTIAVAVETLFEAWNDPARRRQWLEADLTVRKSTAPKSLRITWGDETRVDVTLYPKGPGKSQLSLQHQRLADAEAVETMRAYWSERLGALKQYLEEGAA
jgi:uncharacterized protein YndB with AHSA1/START domain